MPDQLEKLQQLADQLDEWADRNEEICASAYERGAAPAWQASGYMKAYRNAAGLLRDILEEQSKENKMDKIIKEYAARLQTMYDNRTAGDHSFSGLLSEMFEEVVNRDEIMEILTRVHLQRKSQSV